MKTLLRIILPYFFIFVVIHKTYASHGLPLVNVTYTIGATGVTIAGFSDAATCGTGPYWMQAKVSCTPSSFINTLPVACAETYLQNWTGPGVTYNAFPWYSSLLNVPNYNATFGWPDGCNLEAYNNIFIPYTDLCPGKVYYFAVRELVTSSNSIGNFGPIVSFTVPGSPGVELPGFITSNPVTSAANPSCGGGVLLSITLPQGCGPKKTIPPGCTICDTIVWRAPGGVIVAVNTLTVMVNPLVTTTYTVSWDTCNPALKEGCNLIFLPTITVFVANTNAQFLAPPTVCSGSAVNMISLNPSAGNLWSVSPTTSVIPSSSTSQNFTPVFDDVGTFIVTHQAFNGNCTDTKTLSISITPGITASILTSGGGCASSGGTGSAAVVVSTSTTGLTYTWSPSGGNASIANGLIFNTIYTVTLSNVGCIITKTTQVTNNAGPSITSYSVNPPTCSSQGNGSISVALTNGNAPFTFSWSPVVSQNTQTITSLIAGIYTVSVIDNNGCFTSGTVAVNEPSPVILTTSPDVTICAGNTATFSASASGGSGSYTYTWNPGNIISNNLSIAPLTTIQYTCTVRDINGCVNSKTVNVIVNPALQSASFSHTICIGDTLTLIPSITTPGNGGPYQYIWSSGTTNSVLAVPLSTSAGATIYTLQVVDGCNPNAYSQYTVVTIANPSVNIGADVLSGNAPLTVNFTDTGNGSIFNWNFGNGLTSNSQNSTSQFVAGGTYVVTYSVANASGCKEFATLTINVIDLAPQIIIPNVFTPNGDLINDIFEVKGINLIKYECYIYNRWGKMVFNSTDIKTSWDGKIAGSLAEEGTYFYVIKAGGKIGEDYKKQGYLSLFR